MKDFLMGFYPNGNPKFIDPKDRATFGLLLSSIRKVARASGKDELFVLRVFPYEVSTSPQQLKLFEVLCDKVASETGNDYDDVESTFLGNYSVLYKTVQELTGAQYQELLERSLVFSQEFFNLNITVNDNGHFEIRKL